MIADEILVQPGKKITRAERSHFGKVLRRFDQCRFEFCGVPVRFVVVGKGNTRKYALVLLDKNEAAYSMLYSAGIEAILRLTLLDGQQ